jgi:HD-like signal output (HDOD) protein
MPNTTSEKPDPKKIKQDADILYQRIIQEINLGVRPLPAFPPMVEKLSILMRDPNYRIKDLVAVIETDEALSNRLVRIASSSMYPGKEPCENLSSAVRRLGADFSRNLVLMHSLHHTFRSDKKPAQLKTNRLWQLSTQTASIAMWITQHTTGFQADKALLAGLLQELGSLYLIVVMGEKAKTEYHWQLVDHMVMDHGVAMSVAILEFWGMEPAIIECARTRDQWLRDHIPQADLADILIMARYHCYLNTSRIRECPKFTDMPCSHRVKLRKGEMTPFQGLKSVNEHRDEINDIARMLAL